MTLDKEINILTANVRKLKYRIADANCSNPYVGLHVFPLAPNVSTLVVDIRSQPVRGSDSRKEADLPSIANMYAVCGLTGLCVVVWLVDLQRNKKIDRCAISNSDGEVSIECDYRSVRIFFVRSTRLRNKAERDRKLRLYLKKGATVAYAPFLRTSRSSAVSRIS